jgi:hypothetical protein
MTTKFQKVMRAPPTLSASQPPKGRLRETTYGPRKARPTSELFSGNWVVISSGKLAEYPIKEPKVPT